MSDTTAESLARYRMTARERRAPLRLDRKRYTYRKARRIERAAREAMRLFAISPIGFN